MLSSIAAGVVALLLLLAFSIYQTMRTQDNIMDEISDMLMVSDLTGNHIRQDRSAIQHNSGRGFITRRLNAQHNHTTHRSFQWPEAV